MELQAPREKLHSLQSLRAIAALVVLVFHVCNHGAIRVALDLKPEALLALKIAADCAVDCFFVLSGFIMVYTQGLVPRGAAAFAGQRLARIVPLYWVTTLAFAAYVLAFEAREPGLAGAIDQLLAGRNFLASSMLFVSHLLGYPFPVVLPGWSLEYEMLFYAVFAGAILVSRRHTVAITGAVLAALVLSGALRPICLEFAFGAGIGVLWFRGLHRALTGAMLLVAPADVTAGLLTGAYARVGHDDWLRLVLCGVPMTAVFLVALCMVQRRRPALAVLGECSYAIYVSHCAWLAVYVHFFMPLLPSGSGALLLASGIAWCLAGGMAMHYLVERRLDALLRARPRRVVPVSEPGAVPASR